MPSPAAALPDLVREPPDHWVRHVAPLLIFLVAVSTMLVAPFQAARWYRVPFVGALFEHTHVVSSITGVHWPAKTSGMAGGDRLIAVDGVPVATTEALEAALGPLPGRTLRLTLEKFKTGLPYDVTVLTQPLSFYDFASLFLVPYVAGLVFLGLGLWVYSVRGRTRAGRVFLILCSATAVAAGAFFDMNSTHLLVRLWTASLPVAGSALAYLSLVFPEDFTFIRRWPPSRYLSWVPGLLLLGWSEWRLYNPADPRSYFIPWRDSYALALLGILLFLAVLAWRMRRSPSPIIRQQSRIIVLGAAIAFGPLLFYLIPSALSIPVAFAPAVYFPFTIVFPFAVAYSILRYRLPEIDRVLNRGVAYGLLTSVVGVAYFGLLALISAVVGRTVAANDPLVISLSLFAIVISFNPLRDRAQEVVDRLFYRHRADYRRTLEAFSGELTTTLDLTAVLEKLLDRIEKTLIPERALVFLYDEATQTYLPQRGETLSAEAAFFPDGELARFLQGAPAALYLAPEAKEFHDLGGDAQAIRRLGLVVFAPLKAEERLSGWLAVGAKRSGEPYAVDDLNFLSALAAQSALAVENARLFVNLRRNYQQTVEMKNLMDDIFASIPSGVITTDIQDKVINFNLAAERILGIPAENVLGQPYRIALNDLGLQLEALVQQVKSQDRSTTGHELDVEVSARGRLNLRASLSPLKDARQETIGVTIVLEDLTERRQLEADRERIRQTFGRVVAPRVRDKLLSEPALANLAGTRQEITTLFADVRGFTSVSEKLPSEVLFAVLNEYLNQAAQAVLAHEGTIDKFLGDAVMAFFNAPDPQPDHTLRAVKAALDMQAVLSTHRHLLDATYPLYFGVGITVGEAVVGNVGTPELFNYTAIGDPVNLAKRLQENARPGQILLSQAAYLRVRDQVACRPLAPVQVKGREAVEQIYEVVGLKEG